MAVIITNMEMPKSCDECFFSNSSQDNCSLLWIDSIRYSSTDCPLKSTVGFLDKINVLKKVGNPADGRVYVPINDVIDTFYEYCGEEQDHAKNND